MQCCGYGAEMFKWVSECDTEYFWLAAHGDPGSSRLDVGVEEGLVSAWCEKGGGGREMERSLLRVPSSTLPECLVRRSAASATLCNKVEAMKSSASLYAEWLQRGLYPVV